MIGTLLLPLLMLTQTLDSTYDRRALWLTHGPGMTGVVQGIQASPVGGGFFVVGADLLGTAPDRIRLEYRASRAAFKRYTGFGGLDSQLQRFTAAGDSARAHYETFQALSRSERRVKRVFFGALLGAGLLYVASDKKIARDASQGLLLVAYGVGHLSLYGRATAERELDQAIWFYNRTRP